MRRFTTHSHTSNLQGRERDLEMFVSRGGIRHHSRLCSPDEQYRHIRRYQIILHVQHSVFLAAPFLLSQWTPSRFTVEGVSYSCGEQFSLLKRAASSGTTNTSCACPTLASTSNMEEKSVTLNFHVGARARKHCACWFLLQVRPNPNHASTSLGHGRQASCGS